MKTTPVTCLGFIMDGNRRWAKEHDLTSLDGHMKGRDVLHECVAWAKNKHIPHIVFYAFSTENWNRSPEEVTHLMQLFVSELAVIAEKAVNVRVIGNRDLFSDDIVQAITRAEANNSSGHSTTVWIASSYGGRAEIVAAVNQAIAAGVSVDEQQFESLLWTSELPDPDMIVRTGGEQRLSNFLTWKSTYSELLFLDKHWPALTPSDFDDILVAYEGRHRRKGT